MALVIPQFSIALLASIFINELVAVTEKEKLQKLLKNCLYITGGTVAALGLFISSPVSATTQSSMS